MTEQNKKDFVSFLKKEGVYPQFRLNFHSKGFLYFPEKHFDNVYNWRDLAEKYYLTNREAKITDLLSYSFLWRLSNEGDKFWDEIWKKANIIQEKREPY